MYICNMSSPGSIMVYPFFWGAIRGLFAPGDEAQECRPFGLCLCPKWGIPNNCHCNMVERVAPCNWMIFPENSISATRISQPRLIVMEGMYTKKMIIHS